VPNSRDFVQHALDLLAALGPVQARAMFGGHGIYHRGAMFGLLADDELFLKTDGETRERFLAAGCQPWVYVGPRGPQPTAYYRPPDPALEDPEAMLPWARLAAEAAGRAAAAKLKKATKVRAKPPAAAGGKRKARRVKRGPGAP